MKSVVLRRLHFGRGNHPASSVEMERLAIRGGVALVDDAVSGRGESEFLLVPSGGGGVGRGGLLKVVGLVPALAGFRSVTRQWREDAGDVDPHRNRRIGDDATVWKNVGITQLNAFAANV